MIALVKPRGGAHNMRAAFHRHMRQRPLKPNRTSCIKGVKKLRTLILMNEDDMRDRGFSKFDLIDVKSFAKDGSIREVRGYRAIPYNLPRGSAMGYMPELNVLCAIGDYSLQSDQRLMKRVIVEITAAAPSAKEVA